MPRDGCTLAKNRRGKVSPKRVNYRFGGPVVCDRPPDFRLACNYLILALRFKPELCLGSANLSIRRLVHEDGVGKVGVCGGQVIPVSVEFRR